MKNLLALVSALIKGGFYGKLTIKFEKGKIIHCLKEESIKL